MLRFIPTLAALLAALPITVFSTPASAVPITYMSPVPGRAGQADVTFLYNSASSSWVTVFRAKGTPGQPTNTNATNLTAPFNSTSTPATWTGIRSNEVPAVNGDTGDYTFTSLTTIIATTNQLAVTTSGTTTNYYISFAAGSPLNRSLTAYSADLGIRTLFRENQALMGTGTGTNVQQFSTFNLTLNPAASTFNGSPLAGSGAFVSLLGWDAFENPDPLIDSAAGRLTATFGNFSQGHVHRNWGFSQYGSYELAFNLQGGGGAHGATAPTGSTTIGFVVAVPEPSTMALAAAGLAGLAAFARRRRV